ncbi:hypothetical protein PENANT_c001G08468 [Penicillium antarcticum]|uniref:NYN domain-containing protein n=1 Tax=Penicillium antarcticum TaxID=416450 RepID=A0A1V6QNF2_9EURO|nr:uncharacterized protein N7508_010690 [Penicillium antarcticum]KAJ5295869.1 hypothetical protein N7508_010690 [Penicillium antarcticum]OQD90774.1 hypothetical protein PENANT_c001G08468 [Penicillium antarcticum]
MVGSDSTESSNWDFTPALDLLRSPKYEGTPARSSCHLESQSDVQDQPKKDVSSVASGQAVGLASKRSHTKLGDFGPLWEVLGAQDPPSVNPDTSIADPNPEVTQPALQASPAFSVLELPVSHTSNRNSIESSALLPSKTSPVADIAKPKTSASTRGRSKRQAQPITILKRGSKLETDGTDNNVKFESARTPPRTIIGAGSLDTPKARIQPRVTHKETQTTINNSAYSSEASAGAESDSSFIFDRPSSKKFGALAFVPPQIGTPDAQATRYDTPPSSFEDQDFALNAKTIAALAPGQRVQSNVYKSSTERRVSLMTKLFKEFPEYASLASSVGQSVTGFKDAGSKPIHIFVDMSNIMVGFHDAVKLSRNIPLETRIRRIHMSFTNLALIMERGRYAAKRVLVGSDRLPSIDEAETLGYEANIMSRVQKFKHTTPRRNNKPRKIPGFGPSGGPETVASGRWAEQGVDELLHMKILESLVDIVEPATIVLATGDAAVAEYSGGFMCQVERALQRGWSIELVSFTNVTSYAYRKKEFRAQWGDRFKMVELDPYIEELFE